MTEYCLSRRERTISTRYEIIGSAAPLLPFSRQFPTLGESPLPLLRRVRYLQSINAYKSRSLVIVVHES